MSVVPRLLNLIYPSRCPVCEGQTDSFTFSPICKTCWSGIKRYEGPSCSICREPFTSEYATLCGKCLRQRPPFTRAISYGLYSDTLKEALHLLKFSSAKRLAKPLGMLVAGLDMPEVHGIVPVPLSIKGLRDRGFNQTMLISRTVSKGLGIPLFAGLLYKNKETPSQVGLSAKERLLNLRGAFSTRRRLNGEKVLLVDDIMTTGATASECARTLLKAGAGEIFVATVARSQGQ